MMRMADRSRRYLIVNADDFGYSPSVSRGIADAAREGVVTATGVMANLGGLEDQVDELREVRHLDIGVHLNATYGPPLTDQLRRRFEENNGQFPGKFWWAWNVLFDPVIVADLLAEWGAQINRCRALGIAPVFVNSHEHVHMLPRLLVPVMALAQEAGIRFVRRTTPDWCTYGGLPGIIRNASLQVVSLWNRIGAMPGGQPRMFGLAVSGGLDESYITNALRQLKDGEVGELMCHPGYSPAGDITDPRLIRYHHWEQELTVLRSDALRNILERENVFPIGFRHLDC